MNYQFKAHPTLYNGVMFRSRLEARWAAMFDLMGWEWEYEPLDLNGWSPDFMIKGRNNNVLVEVKPIVWPNDGKLLDKLIEKEPALEKVRQYKKEVLVLGNAPLGRYYGTGEDNAIGVLVEEYTDEDHVHELLFGEKLTREYIVVDGAIVCYGYYNKFDFRAALMSYHYRLGGEYDGDHHIKSVEKPTLLRDFWREAGNKVQKQFR